jgi:predicted phosphodiesterase
MRIRSLPGTAVINDSVFLCHGTPASDTTYLLEDVISGNPHVRPARSIAELLGSVREPAILCGHSHIARMIQLPGGQLVLNPGSVGLPAYEDALPVNHFMETYAPHASYAVLEARSGSWIVSFHRVRYEWDEAAMRARELGREDWAQALAAGRMR